MKKLQILIGVVILASADTPPKPGDVTEARVMAEAAATSMSNISVRSSR